MTRASLQVHVYKAEPNPSLPDGMSFEKSAYRLGQHLQQCISRQTLPVIKDQRFKGLTF